MKLDEIEKSEESWEISIIKLVKCKVSRTRLKKIKSAQSNALNDKPTSLQESESFRKTGIKARK